MVFFFLDNHLVRSAKQRINNLLLSEKKRTCTTHSLVVQARFKFESRGEKTEYRRKHKMVCSGHPCPHPASLPNRPYHLTPSTWPRRRPSSWSNPRSFLTERSMFLVRSQGSPRTRAQFSKPMPVRNGVKAPHQHCYLHTKHPRLKTMIKNQYIIEKCLLTIP